MVSPMKEWQNPFSLKNKSMKNLLSILFLFSFAHLIFGQNQDRNTFSSNTLYVGKSITAPEAYDTNKENYYDEIFLCI